MRLARWMLVTAAMGALMGCGDDDPAKPEPKPAFVVYVESIHLGVYECAFVNYGEVTARNVYVKVSDCGKHGAGYTTPRDIPPYDRYNPDTIGRFPDPAPECLGGGVTVESISWE
jgi:hypothetical protein